MCNIQTPNGNEHVACMSSGCLLAINVCCEYTAKGLRTLGNCTPAFLRDAETMSTSTYHALLIPVALKPPYHGLPIVSTLEPWNPE